MEIIKLSEGNQFPQLMLAETVLQNGGVVVVPTDTVYGLLADATNESAVKKIYAIKNRPDERALPIFVKDITMARWYVYISDEKAERLKNVWPGKMTVVLHHKEKLPSVLTGGGDTIGVRISDSWIVSKLLEKMNVPLAQTSANISNMPTAATAKEVEEYFKNGKVKPELILDGGTIEGRASTIIDYTENAPKVIRVRAVSKDELDQILSAL